MYSCVVSAKLKCPVRANSHRTTTTDISTLQRYGHLNFAATYLVSAKLKCPVRANSHRTTTTDISTLQRSGHLNFAATYRRQGQTGDSLAFQRPSLSFICSQLLIGLLRWL